MEKTTEKDLDDLSFVKEELNEEVVVLKRKKIKLNSELRVLISTIENKIDLINELKNDEGKALVTFQDLEKRIRSLNETRSEINDQIQMLKTQKGALLKSIKKHSVEDLATKIIQNPESAKSVLEILRNETDLLNEKRVEFFPLVNLSLSFMDDDWDTYQYLLNNFTMLDRYYQEYVKRNGDIDDSYSKKISESFNIDEEEVNFIFRFFSFLSDKKVKNLSIYFEQDNG
jgi:chromosome segregation ATPase